MRSPSKASSQSSRSSQEQTPDKHVDIEKDAIYRDEAPSRPGSIGSGVAGPSSTKTVLRFPPGDPENPYNWSAWKKAAAVFCVISTVLNSTMGSSLPSGASAQLAAYFGVHSQLELVLPTSIFLVGYVFGPLVFGPLSEHYGRKGVMCACLFTLALFTMACALAPTWAALIAFRFVCGACGSCPIAVVGGICADIYSDPTSRGRSMAVFMAATCFGPLVGPIISGYTAPISWRWPFWIALILAGITFVLLCLIPETYGPVLLKRRARRLRKQSGGKDDVWAQIELEESSWRHIFTVVLMRPLRMIVFEPLVLFTCIYTALIYAMLYMFFQAYPIIYEGIYNFTPGQTGLALIPIGIGSSIACGMYLYYDKLLARARARDAPWSRSVEMRRLPLGCVAGPFIVAGLFWAGWTASASIHWLAPVSAGVSFGIGFLLVFMSLINMLVDAYDVFAASALAAASTFRSLFGAVLPFATTPMYERLGVAWACSLLGFLTLAMCVIPFAFVRYGELMRRKSRFCRYLEEKRREEEEERARGREEERGGECADGESRGARDRGDDVV
ncbi:major facilitator superfamily domain-containing protein [Lineolata rhizophorae]|uniref:Major facilitator superfamily domain-containing protein n=1 Tax=Lineolata rhizophorae TaxID=578093 RepID=A0A6A6PD91_9PEZI|nr:major facilitator superfamily domain-containing protein [Lineolata rhizophorae]